MGVFRIGEAVCNNCVHWRCHSERKFSGSPPKEVYTTSNCDKCSLTDRNTLSGNTCGMFRHIGGVSATCRPSVPVEQPNPGESFLSAVMGYIRDSQAIDAATELMNRHLRDEEERVERRKAESTRQILVKHGMRRDASPSDRQTFEVLYENAVKDDPEAQLYLAHCFQHGEHGAVRNATLAAKWCLKSACHNNATAQNLLGTFYVKGFGVEKDLRKAGALFRSAAKLGSREAAENYKILINS